MAKQLSCQKDASYFFSSPTSLKLVGIFWQWIIAFNIILCHKNPRANLSARGKLIA